MQNQIKELKAQGLSIRKIALALDISRQTVRKYESGAPCDAHEPVKTGTVKQNGGWWMAIDWDAVILQLRSKGTTAKQLHREIAPSEVSYWSFWRQLRTRMAPQLAIRLRREHLVGERTEIDYADGVAIIDATTGEVRKTHLFCGVLPFSSYVFGEFVWNQQLPTFIASHERMWHFFGGVTPYVIPDNLKAGVIRAHRYDPDVNPVYCDYANHAGFAVLPARPYKPRDKAVVEATIGVIQRDFYAQVRQQTFYDLPTLNAAFATYLGGLNQNIMKDYGVSRAQRFEEEQRHLKPLPVSRFELAEWRRAKVHPDCHIQVLRNFYSVPHTSVGMTVRVRIGTKLVEIFNDALESLAVHPRQLGIGKFATNEQHYPDKKLVIKRFEVHTAENMARTIGPHTNALVQTLVGVNYPLRYLRRIQGILRLMQSGHVGRDALEYACHMALLFNKPRFAYIKACAEHYQANGCSMAVIKPVRKKETLFLHQEASREGGAA